MSTRILILKDGVITPSRSSNDIAAINTSLGITASLALKANLVSPALTGTPTVPTATAGTNTTQIANTAFVSTAISNLVNTSPAALDTLNELATALGNDPNFATTVTSQIALKADLASPTFIATIRVGAALGNIRLTQGSTITSGYLGIYKGDSTTRLGYIGYDNTNLTYASEGAAVHSFTGNRVDILGGIIPPTTSSRISFFINGGSAYSSLICGTAAVNYKAYDICNESGNFSIRRITDGYLSAAGTLLSHTTGNVLTLGNTATKSAALYGSITVGGENNNYAGIHFPSSADGSTFMLGITSRVNGVWSPTNGWQWLYDVGKLSIRSGEVASEGSYIGLFKGLGSLPGYPSGRYPTVSTDFSVLYFSVAGAYSAHINVSGVYTAVSDKNKKTVVEEINEEQTLERISRLPINRYFFNAEDERITRIGTFAQDFYREFGCGGNQDIVDDDSPTSPDKMLAVSDVAGVCLAGIKGLIAKITNIEKEISEIKYASLTTN